MENKNEIITIEVKNNNGEEGTVHDTLRDLRRKRNNLIFRKDCKVTVGILAYNRLEKTKECVESVLKYTKGIPYQLLLIDNGSEKDTMEYFTQVKHENKLIIRFTENINVGVFSIVESYCNTTFLTWLPNDVVVTENWLKNLLICAESDERIGLVCTVSTNTSNLQQETLGGFSSIEEMQEKARRFNKSDSTKWEERMRLIPVCPLWKKEASNLIGLIDNGIYHDFSEDDLCIRLRRAGYKLMLCKDTFVHHNHDYSNLSREKREEFQTSLDNGKRNFMEKYHGLDPWEDINNYLQGILSLVTFQSNPLQGYQVLGIDVRCGTPILDIRNLLRSQGCFNSDSYAFTTQAKYYTELLAICDEVISDRIDGFLKYYQERFFDFIVLGEPINGYEHPIGLLEQLLKLTKEGGTLLVSLKNTYDIKTFFNIMKQGAVPREEDNITHLYCNDFLNIIKVLNVKDVKLSGLQNVVAEETKLIMKKTIEASGLLGKNEVRSKIEEICVDKYWFCITK